MSKQPKNTVFNPSLFVRRMRMKKAHHAPPILQGFGIAQPSQVKEALQLGAAGAISGSATVKIIERNLDNHAQCLNELGEFVRNMKAATK